MSRLLQPSDVRHDVVNVKHRLAVLLIYHVAGDRGQGECVYPNLESEC